MRARERPQRRASRLATSSRRRRSRSRSCAARTRLRARQPGYLELVGEPRHVLGKPLLEALPELARPGHRTSCSTVYATRRSRTSAAKLPAADRANDAAPCDERYFDFVYAAAASTPQATGRPHRRHRAGARASTSRAGARARARRRAANRAKDEFLAMLGHELRNPLAPILTALQLMRLRGAGVERERDGHRAPGRAPDAPGRRPARRLAHHARQDRAAQASAVELADGRRAAPSRWRSPLLEQRSTIARRRVAPRGLARRRRPGRLAQVVANLLTNAAKYTEPAAAHLAAARRARRRARRVARARQRRRHRARHAAARLRMFVQEPQTLDRSQGGLGLGLDDRAQPGRAARRQRRRASDGRRQGSEFIVALARSDADPAGRRRPQRRRRSSVEPARQRRVLVVDDNHDAAAMLGRRCAHLGTRRRDRARRPDRRCASPETSARSRAARHRAAGDGRLRARAAPAARRPQPRSPGRDHRLRAGDRPRARSAEAGFAHHLVKPVDLGGAAAPDRRAAARRSIRRGRGYAGPRCAQRGKRVAAFQHRHDPPSAWRSATSLTAR